MAKRGPTKKQMEIYDLKAHAKAALPRALAMALQDRKVSADAGTMLGDLIEVWGGTRQLACDIHAEFQRAPKGGMTRQRILEMFQRLIMHTSDRDMANTARPADMTQEELDAVALVYAKRVMGNDDQLSRQPTPRPGPVEEEEEWAEG